MAAAPVTLVEAAKQMATRGEMGRAGIIMTFAQTSPLLAAMPFEDVPSLIYPYLVEGALPGVAFRGINDTYDATYGILNPQAEALKIVGGEIITDKALVRGYGPRTRATQVQMQAKSLADKLQYTMVKGDSSATPKEFDGLERRLGSGSQVISNNSGSGGGALSIAKLDAAIDACEGATHLFMRKSVRRNMKAYLRTSPFISESEDAFGRPLTKYAGLPILEADAFGVTTSLTQTEACSGGGASAATSVYVLHLESGWCSGLQNGIMDISDLGEMQSRPAFLNRLEWYVSLYIPQPRAVVRLRDITDATAVA